MKILRTITQRRSLTSLTLSVAFVAGLFAVPLAAGAVPSVASCSGPMMR